MFSPRILIVLFAAIAVSVGVVACGGDDNESTSATTAPAKTTAPAGKTTAPTGTGAAASVLKVTAADLKFEPTDVDAPLNKEVTIQLTNSGNVSHTLTVYEDDAHTKKLAGASVQVPAGKTGEFNVTFTKAGDYYFRCEIHPAQMTGEIKVS